MDPMTVAAVAGASKVIVEAFMKLVSQRREREQEERKRGGGTKTTPPQKRIIKPVFGGYTTRNEGFRNELLRQSARVHSYAARQGTKRPMNILLAGRPGTGKSFLVKQLAEERPKEVVFEEFHVASFQDIGDLHGVFHRIQSANLAGKVPFVLLDEVDGKVAGRHIYANLLAPMWDGVFHVGKESFHLGRAVLFFGASDLIPAPTVESVLGSQRAPGQGKVSYKEFAKMWYKKVSGHAQGSAKRNTAVPKARDFVDRIDIWICIPPLDDVFSDGNAEEERIDLACLMVQKHFPTVVMVDLRAISVLAALSQEESRRRAESIVFQSSPAALDRFGFDDLPEEARDEVPKSVATARAEWIEVKVEVAADRR